MQILSVLIACIAFSSSIDFESMLCRLQQNAVVMRISGVCNPPDLQIVTNLIKAVEKGPSLTITIHVCGLMLHSLYSRSPQTTYIFKTHGS